MLKSNKSETSEKNRSPEEIPKDRRAAALTMLTCSPTVQNYIDHCKTAYESYPTLQQKYEKRKGSIQVIMAELIEWGSFDDVVNKMYDIWNRLLRVWPECSEYFLTFAIMSSMRDKYPIIHQSLFTKDELTFNDIIDAITAYNADSSNNNVNQAHFVKKNHKKWNNAKQHQQQNAKSSTFKPPSSAQSINK